MWSTLPSAPAATARSMKLSVVIPAHNEVESIAETVERTVAELERAGIEHEVLVIDDASGDGTGDIVTALSERIPTVRGVRSHLPPGFGHAVRAGLELYTGDARGQARMSTDRARGVPRPPTSTSRPRWGSRAERTSS